MIYFQSSIFLCKFCYYESFCFVIKNFYQNILYIKSYSISFTSAAISSLFEKLVLFFFTKSFILSFLSGKIFDNCFWLPALSRLPPIKIKKSFLGITV